MNAEITQELLREYHELYKHEKQTQARREGMRAEILWLHQQGASVQPGRFQLNVFEKKRDYISWPRVSKALGEEMCNWLRKLIPPVPVTYVTVRKESLRSGSNDELNPSYPMTQERRYLPLNEKHYIKHGA